MWLHAGYLNTNRIGIRFNSLRELICVCVCFGLHFLLLSRMWCMKLATHSNSDIYVDFVLEITAYPICVLFSPSPHSVPCQASPSTRHHQVTQTVLNRQHCAETLHLHQATALWGCVHALNTEPPREPSRLKPQAKEMHSFSPLQVISVHSPNWGSLCTVYYLQFYLDS